MKTRKCHNCLKTKPLSEFYEESTHPNDSHQRICKECGLPRKKIAMQQRRQKGLIKDLRKHL